MEQQLTAAGFRVAGDYRAAKIGAKIRDAQLELTPYMFIVGREMAEGKVSVRDRLEGDLGPMAIDAALAKLQAEVAAKTVRQVAKTSAGMGQRGEENLY